MKTRTWTSAAWLILVLGLTGQWAVQAQTSLTLPTTGTAGSGSTAVDFELRLDGSIIEKGIGATSTLSNADLQAYSRFIWDPSLFALRAGWGMSTETISNIGYFSVAFGDQSTASGDGALAAGIACNASGTGAIALGTNSNATATSAVALGGSTASNYNATAVGESTASGMYSTSMGLSVASGDFSTAAGLFPTANSYGSFVIGSYNIGKSENGGTPSLTAWNNTPTSADPLFEIGNGIGSGATPHSDALVVYKDGNTAIQGNLDTGGIITAAPGGDIPMYAGN